MQKHGLRRLRYKLRPYILQFKQKLPPIKTQLYLKQQWVKLVVIFNYKVKMSFEKVLQFFLGKKKALLVRFSLRLRITYLAFCWTRAKLYFYFEKVRKCEVLKTIYIYIYYIKAKTSCERVRDFSKWHIVWHSFLFRFPFHPNLAFMSNYLIMVDAFISMH